MALVFAFHRAHLPMSHLPTTHNMLRVLSVSWHPPLAQVALTTLKSLPWVHPVAVQAEVTTEGTWVLDLSVEHPNSSLHHSVPSEQCPCLDSESCSVTMHNTVGWFAAGGLMVSMRIHDFSPHRILGPPLSVMPDAFPLQGNGNNQGHKQSWPAVHQHPDTDTVVMLHYLVGAVSRRTCSDCRTEPVFTSYRCHLPLVLPELNQMASNF